MPVQSSTFLDQIKRRIMDQLIGQGYRLARADYVRVEFDHFKQTESGRQCLLVRINLEDEKAEEFLDNLHNYGFDLNPDIAGFLQLVGLERTGDQQRNAVYYVHLGHKLPS